MQRLLVFLDSTLNPSAASWQLRNLLAFLAIRFGVTSIRVLCLRATSETSRVVTLKLPGPGSYGPFTRRDGTADSAQSMRPAADGSATRPASSALAWRIWVR